jgi:hypothetical protein
MKTRLLLLGILLAAFYSNAQDNTYLTVGYGFEKYLKLTAFPEMISDYNAQRRIDVYDLKDELGIPEYSRGLVLGVKHQVENFLVGFDLYNRKYKSVSHGLSSRNDVLDKILKISHSGFSVFYGLNLTHDGFVRMGPAISLNCEQMKVSIKHAYSITNTYMEMSWDKFYLSFSLKFPFSFGGDDFNFDVIPYYQIPFYSFNLTEVNAEMNEGHASSYTLEEMTFSPKSAGFMINLNFGTDW